MSLPDSPFRGTDRFKILRELGRGGMGVVYEVHDRARDEVVALKTLSWASPAALYRFKKEFRTLVDVVHSNLVSLHELFADDDAWFFTMELVDGSTFLEYVRPGYRRVSGASRTAAGVADPAAATSGAVTADRPAGRLDIARLRATLRQLAEAVAVLHGAGIVHRDLKPSNVMVSRSGRVVILDFGLAAEMMRGDLRATVEEGIWGTVAYMAPEQGSAAPCGPMADWYAVGTLLYEALTGRLPYEGSLLYVLTQKALADPPRPDELVADLPRDLVDLTVALMAREPEGRPADEEVLDRLGAALPAPPHETGSFAPPPGPFIGRQHHLKVMNEALDAAAAGEAVAVYISGPSGIGKSTLIQHYVDRVVQRDRAVALGGRCYLRESMPYKAIDGVIDALSHFLRGLPRTEVRDLVPEDISLLTGLFPVLERVEVVAERAAEAPTISDPLLRRRLAFRALRALLRNVSTLRPIIVHIDDLQWTDADSVRLLQDLLAAEAGSPLRLLLIGGFRSEEAHAVPALQSLLDGGTPNKRLLELGPLTREESVELARSMLRTASLDALEAPGALVRESEGNPFLIDQFMRFVIEAEGRVDTRSLSLTGVLNARVQQLPPSARRLLEVLSVRGRPLDDELAYRAAGVPRHERIVVRRLHAAHFVRTSATGRKIEVYHDRIRETVSRQLDARASQAIHRRLVECLEAAGVDDPEALFEHSLAVGDTERAATYAVQAARYAQAALAFERAATFYERALELGRGNDAERRDLLSGLGDSLACAGRSGDAGRAFLQAAGHAAEPASIELLRRAGQQFLIAGYFEDGLAVLDRVLAQVGLPRLARSRGKALLYLILGRIRLRLRGLRFVERSVDEIPAGELTRVDTCWAVAQGLALVDPAHAAAFQTHHTRLALQAGESVRIVRSLAMEAGFRASAGAFRGARRVLREAMAMADRSNSEYARGICAQVAGVVAFHEGDCHQALALFEEGHSTLRRQVALSDYHVSGAGLYMIHTLAELGDVTALCQLSTSNLRDGTDQGSLFATTVFRSGWSTLVWLVQDDLAGARTALAAARAQCPKAGFLVPHFECMLAQVLIDLYAGDGLPAFQHISEVWPALKKSLLMHVETITLASAYQRAGCALAAAQEGGPASLLRVARRGSRRLRGTRHPGWRAVGSLVGAGAHACAGDRAAALRDLETALDGLAACDWKLFHATALRRRGELLGGDSGAEVIAAADRWMAQQSIVNPRRMTNMLAPGFP